MRIRNLEQLDYVPCIMSYSTKRPAAVTAILELELEQFVGSFNTAETRLSCLRLLRWAIWYTSYFKRANLLPIIQLPSLPRCGPSIYHEERPEFVGPGPAYSCQ